MAAAEGAAATTLEFMLNPERAARLVEYNSRDNTQPGLIAVMDKLIASTWKTAQQGGYKGELQRMVNNLALKQLLTLAADEKASESVRGIALLEINDLKLWLIIHLRTAGDNNTSYKANIIFGLSQISAFEKEPAQFKPATPVPMPDGSPIGEGE
jgi:hypothetical protein